MTDHETPRCVCCGAKADGTLGDEPDLPVCKECYHDGTLKIWMEAEIEKVFIADGYTSRVVDGKTLCTPPDRQ